MYPLLVAAGGSFTLAWDYRKDAAKLVKRREKLPIPLESENGGTHHDDVELAPVPSRSESQPSRSESQLRQRTIPPTQAEPMYEHTQIMTPSTPLAIAMGVTLVVGIITLLVTRSQLAQPPRALDFFCNMLVAGVIIFGGGPVVIPLLKGYTVDNGKSLSVIADSRLGSSARLSTRVCSAASFPWPQFCIRIVLGRVRWVPCCAN